MAGFLQNFLTGVFNSDGYMRDFQHARALYRDDNIFDLAPKAGWMYYVRLEINPDIASRLNSTWRNRFSSFVGILAKNVSLPKFTIATEVVNQYNRKSVVQSKLNYAPLSITFHDDMANATTDLWQNYYNYMNADARLNYQSVTRGRKRSPGFSDNKYDTEQVYPYGFANGQGPKFFTGIDIYLLNKQRFQSFSLINPVIKGWEHGTVSQDSGNKMLESKMEIEFETVLYNKGRARLTGITNDHYDNTPSPLRVGANATVFGPGGIINQASDLIADYSDLDPNKPLGFLDYAGLGIRAVQIANQATKITGAQLKKEGYSILLNQLGVISRVGLGGAVSNLTSAFVGGSVDVFNQTRATNNVIEAKPFRQE